MGSSNINKFNKNDFLSGMRDGIPIGLGYLAVSFSLGIAARKAGLTAWQDFAVSLLCNASAGEYAGFMSIAAGAPYLELILITLITNARYFLMSFAMSQRMSPDVKLRHRLLMSYDITDEIFAVNISQSGYLKPFYMYGVVAVAAPSWSVGTALGIVAGNILPANIVSALGVALYGMFLAIIIPPAKKDRVIAGIVVFCFTASAAAAYIPVFSGISSGTKTIVLTVAISALAAALFPREAEQ